MTDGNDAKRPSFEMNLDTRIVLDRFKTVSVGQTITFAELGTALGRAVGGGAPVIQSAIRKLEAEGIIFANVRGVGYQRLTDIAIVNTVEAGRVSLRRKAKKLVRRLASVNDFDALPNDAKIKHNAAMSGFGAIAAILAPGKMKELESAVEKTAQTLPLAKTLEVFK